MRKKVYGLLAAVFCFGLLAGVPAGAASGKVPSYVGAPEEGGYTMGGESTSEIVDGHSNLGTDFYLYIENPAKETEAPVKQSGNLPKTGDYGMDKNVLLWVALICGAGYLACDRYEKKKV